MVFYWTVVYFVFGWIGLVFICCWCVFVVLFWFVCILCIGILFWFCWFWVSCFVWFGVVCLRMVGLLLCIDTVLTCLLFLIGFVWLHWLGWWFCCFIICIWLVVVWFVLFCFLCFDDMRWFNVILSFGLFLWFTLTVCWLFCFGLLFWCGLVVYLFWTCSCNTCNCFWGLLICVIGCYLCIWFF